MTYRYLVYELVVETTFPCLFLQVAPGDMGVDVTVVEGDVPKRLPSPTLSLNNWDASPGKFLLRCGPKSGRFLVEDGCRVTLQRGVHAEPDRLAVSFFVSVLTALLQQRDLLVLHANTALTSNGAIAVSGASGAGKTTAISGILSKGFKLLADDITVLRIGTNGVIEVLPGAPHLHLCEDTAEQFGFDISNVPRYPWRRMKAALPVYGIMAHSPAPLQSIYLLKLAPRNSISVKKLAGKDKFDALQECIYGPFLPDCHARFFSVFATVMTQVDLFLVERPKDQWTLDELVTVMTHG